jgi:hypothetical protein
MAAARELERHGGGRARRRRRRAAAAAGDAAAPPAESHTFTEARRAVEETTRLQLIEIVRSTVGLLDSNLAAALRIAASYDPRVLYVGVRVLDAW